MSRQACYFNVATSKPKVSLLLPAEKLLFGLSELLYTVQGLYWVVIHCTWFLYTVLGFYTLYSVCRYAIGIPNIVDIAKSFL